MKDPTLRRVSRGCPWVNCTLAQPLSLPFWPKPIIRVGLPKLTTIQSWVRVPIHMQLCSVGFPVGFRVTTFYPRFAD